MQYLAATSKSTSLYTACKTYNFSSYFISRLWLSYRSRKLVKSSILLYTKRLYATLAIAFVSKRIIIIVVYSIVYSRNLTIAKLSHLPQYKPIKYTLVIMSLVILISRFEYEVDNKLF